LNEICVLTSAPNARFNQNLLAEASRRSDLTCIIEKETKMNLALIGAAAIAAAAFATPVLAQAVIEEPGYCTQYSPNANCQNMGQGNPYTDGGYWQKGNAVELGYATQSAEPEAYRYHGGPKSND
jgi:hypothetical protein